MEQELLLPEYQGLTVEQAYALLKSKTETRIGRIEGENLKDVVTLLCNGIDWRLSKAPDSPIKSALIRGFGSMTLPGFGFNLNDSTVMGLLNAANNTTVNIDGLEYKLITDEEKAKFIELATYTAPKFPEVTIAQVAEYLIPGITVLGNWIEVQQYQGNRLQLTLNSSLPSTSLIRVEASYSSNGVDWSSWERVTHFYNIKEAGVYFTQLPISTLQRKLRCRGEEYAIDGSVVGV